MNELARKKCQPCEGGVAPLGPEQVRPLLKGLQGWALDGREIITDALRESVRYRGRRIGRYDQRGSAAVGHRYAERARHARLPHAALPSDDRQRSNVREPAPSTQRRPGGGTAAVAGEWLAEPHSFGTSRAHYLR
jgi:hypothetical protein